jgi:GntR family transcriptional regulator / MocR family aminotransferase
MPKPSPLLVSLDRSKPLSLQSQLSASLKRLVHTGVLRPGSPVPSSRELARDLLVSRNTVLQAYDRLVGEGYLEASPRRGLFVSELLQERTLRKAGPADTPGSVSVRTEQHNREWGRAPTPFSPCQPDIRLFPLQIWNRMRKQALSKHGRNLLQYQSHEPLGLPALRRSLARYLQGSRGVRCNWRQIAITTGSQQALFLLAHLLLKPGDSVVMEDPGYLGARLAWQYMRATIHPIPVDASGMNLEGARHLSPKLLYSTPSRQFPVGSCLSLPRRLELVEFAARRKAWIVEDDYDSEFRFSRAPLPSLQSLDSSERVIYVGSTSKVLFPSLRIGYVVLPPPLVVKFANLRSIMDEHGPLMDQAALAEFIETGAFYSHIRRSRREYGHRLEVFLESTSRLSLPISFPHTDGGMNLAGFLDNGIADDKLSASFRAIGLDIPALSRYSLRAASPPGLLFGFTAFEPATIRKSMQTVARILGGH